MFLYALFYDGRDYNYIRVNKMSVHKIDNFIHRKQTIEHNTNQIKHPICGSHKLTQDSLNKQTKIVRKIDAEKLHG